MTLYIALLRGINVGGKQMPMAKLRALCESLGFTQARTLLQSGNVVFETTLSDSAEIVTALETGIVRTFGFDSTVILRTFPEWQTVVAGCRFTPEQLQQSSYSAVVFLADHPTADGLVALRTAHRGDEIIQQNGRDLYIFYGEGMGRSKLTTNLIEKHLRTRATARNWNTVLKLWALRPDDLV